MKNHVISVRLNQNESEIIQRICDSNSISKGEALRKIIHTYAKSGLDLQRLKSFIQDETRTILNTLKSQEKGVLHHGTE